MAVDDIVAKGHDIETVKRIEHLLYIAEYKRRQSAPGVKITGKQFGRSCISFFNMNKEPCYKYSNAKDFVRTIMWNIL